MSEFLKEIESEVKALDSRNIVGLAWASATGLVALIFVIVRTITFLGLAERKIAMRKYAEDVEKRADKDDTPSFFL